MPGKCNIHGPFQGESCLGCRVFASKQEELLRHQLAEIEDRRAGDIRRTDPVTWNTKKEEREARELHERISAEVDAQQKAKDKGEMIMAIVIALAIIFGLVYFFVKGCG